MAFLTGIVEGFYGRNWGWQDRLDTARFMQLVGLDSYLYCPKSDPFLRKQWHGHWPTAEWEALAGMARHYRDAGLEWGVGLSPYALYQDYGAPQRRQLQDKIRRLNELGGSLLAVLFDDMPGDCPDLARVQGDIVGDIMEWSQAKQLLVCPTYYSFDPVLERFFGQRPSEYWRDFGAGVPADVDILWTGNQVCSAEISLEDARAARQVLGRKPCLWDNYPVNDGENACNYLYMKPLSARENGLGQELSGHFCNPMNQALLSRYPLVGLARLYGGAGAELEELYSKDLCRVLRRDMELFQVGGLGAMTWAEREQVARVYSVIDDPAAREVAEWLQGGFQFDPDCLTG